MRPAPILLALPFALWSVSAAAEPAFSLHSEAAAAAPLGAPKDRQFGWGGSGVLAPELSLHETFGIQLAVGAIVLSDGVGGDPPGVAPTGVGVAGFSTIGPTVRPLATLADKSGPFDLDGLWITGGVGAGLTGSAVRPALRAAIGWDAVSESVSGGPFLGFMHLIEPDAGSVRPEDARVVLFGLHGSVAPASRHRVEPLDSDGDQIADDVDACPAQPEDRDGFRDADGCPDPDNDGDGIADARDRCVSVPEDLDGVEDQDGCPESDADHDGVPDARDACVLVAEDRDGVRDEDGCPEEDGDLDGIADAADSCPLEPETVNGIRDDDGCPDTADLHVDRSRIVLDERVHFETARADVSVKSWPLLARVAAFLGEHPEYLLVHVAGHADDTGDDAYNFELSRARAASVRDLLVRGGVDSSRLVVDAFGESQPRARGTDVASRAANRRVELEILSRAEGDGGVP
jgi:outer membrane protein OmpA-like peptidoglycan-associated protein